MPVRTCPKCKGTRVHRSRRRSFYERWVLRLALLRPYRCHDCNLRFHGFAFSKSAWPVGREPVEPQAEEGSARDTGVER